MGGVWGPGKPSCKAKQPLDNRPDPSLRLSMFRIGKHAEATVRQLRFVYM